MAFGDLHEREIDLLLAVHARRPQMTTSTDAAKITCSNALSILTEMDTFNAALNSAAKLLYDAIVVVNYMDTGKEIVNNYVDAYLRTFVFIIWACGHGHLLVCVISHL